VTCSPKEAADMGGGRRDNLFIRFACEGCDAGPAFAEGSLTLCVVQHKGCTFVTWQEK
jgi:hypothetical protein